MVSPKIIHLNIGGKKFDTTEDTFTLPEPDSLLAAMFSNESDQDGYIFIDRDGKHFRHILNWLRDGVVPIMKTGDYMELLREAEYFQLVGLVEEIKAKVDESFKLTRTDIIHLISPNVKLQLRGADLSGVDLSRLDLIGANLVNANLEGAKLYDANLEGANLQGANLIGARLTDANLKGANLQGANLDGAKLIGANLKRANLHGAIMDGVDLTDADLKGADLQWAGLRRAVLKYANLTEAKMEGARLLGADLEEAILNHTESEFIESAWCKS